MAFALIKTEGLDEVGRERVVREAQAIGRMGTHPHIVSIFDFGEHEGAPYVVTELMGGGDVEGLLEDAEGPLPLAQSLEIAKATARGLVFADEQRVVHRDLKPGNVWLTAEGVAKIGDFGLAVAEGRSRLTQHGMMVGTFGYMPPEQALGGEVTPQADLYSLGAILYEAVTGAPPFAGDDATAVISQHINTAPVRPSLRSDHDNDAMLSLIEEGLDARVIEELDRPGRYRFTHALMRETLLAELSTTRRVRLHGRIAEAIESLWGERARNRASRLALLVTMWSRTDPLPLLATSCVTS